MGELLKNTSGGQSEAPLDPELWFHVDEQALSYLNAVLAMAPPMPVENNEVRFVHRPETGWVCTSKGAAVNLAESFDLERALRDVELLRKENESLKFKKELASIDTEVLRSENTELKTELDILREQLHSSRQEMESLRQENGSLRTDVNNLREQTAVLEQRNAELRELLSESAAPECTEDNVAQATPPLETAAPPGRSETDPLHAPLPSDGDQSPPLLPSVSAEEIRSLVDTSNAAANIGHAGGSQPSSPQKTSQGTTERTLVVFTQGNALSRPVRSPAAGLKVLKPGATLPTVKVITQGLPDAPRHDSPVASDASATLSGTAPATPKTELPDAVTETQVISPSLLQDPENAIKLKPAPAPRAIVRKNYEAIQNEADSPPLPQHNITFVT